jgi:FkbM family methyltransferase
VRSARRPSRRALTALARLHGRRLTRRPPFLARDASPPEVELRDLLEIRALRAGSLAFLSVGAFDGVTNDPLAESIRRFPCRGIFVEPQEAAFRALEANYREFEGVVAVQAAVDDRAGSRELHFVPSGTPGVPDWARQLASFSRDHVLKHRDRIPGLDGLVRTREVRTVTFLGLLEEHDLARLDVLQLDVEGEDERLIRSFPFSRLRPAVVRYEATHLEAEARASLRGFLEELRFRYVTSAGDEDETAIDVSAF